MNEPDPGKIVRKLLLKHEHLEPGKLHLIVQVLKQLLKFENSQNGCIFKLLRIKNTYHSILYV